LHIGAQTVIAGVDWKEEIRPVAIRSHPCAIKAKSPRWISSVDSNVVSPGIADCVDQRLASLWLCGRMVFLVRLHLEVNFIGPAPRSRETRCRRILSKHRKSEEQHKQCRPDHWSLSLAAYF
jgi:hypothetical protein